MNKFDDDDSSPTFWGAAFKALLWIVGVIFSVIEPIANAIISFVSGCIVSLFWFIFALLSYIFGNTIRALIIISILSIILSLLIPAFTIHHLSR